MSLESDERTKKNYGQWPSVKFAQIDICYSPWCSDEKSPQMATKHENQ